MYQILGALGFLAAVALSLLIGLIVNVVVLWVSQKIVLPTEKEKGFLSILALAIIGAVVTFVLGFIPVIGWLIAIVVWVWIIKAWFNIGWLHAIAIAILAWVIMYVVSYILGLALYL